VPSQLCGAQPAELQPCHGGQLSPRSAALRNTLDFVSTSMCEGFIEKGSFKPHFVKYAFTGFAEPDPKPRLHFF